MTRFGSRTRIGVLVAAALITMSTTPAAAAVEDGNTAWTVRTANNDFGAERPNFSYDVSPGQSIADTMVVTNTGTVSLPLDIYAADAFTTIDGNIDLVPAGTPSIDAGIWIEPGRGAVTLAPGESSEIPFLISVPADAAPGDHSAALVTSLTSQDSSQAIEVDRRLGTRINLRVAGDLVPDAAVTVVATDATSPLNPFQPMTVRVTYRIENTGNTRVTGSEALNLHTIAGLLGTTRVEPQLPEILPRSTVEIVREIPVSSLGWVGGSVAVTAEGVGLGAASIGTISADLDAVAIPWSLLVVIVLVAGGAVTVLLLVRRRKASAAASLPDQRVSP